MSRTRDAASYFRMTCPHCGNKAFIRDSEQKSTLVRSLVFACTNYECGHVFSALLSVEYTLSPSAIPDPNVVLPLSPKIRGDILRRQLDMFLKDPTK